MTDQQKAQKIKARYAPQWLAMKQVAAIGIGRTEKGVGIIISVTEDPEKVRKQIPARIKNIPVSVQQTGDFKAN